MSIVVVNNPPSTTTVGNLTDKHIQQGAVDLSLSRVWKISDDLFTIDEQRKVLRSTDEVDINEDGYWHLEEGSYEIVMDHPVTMGDNEFGMLITRSSLSRSGVSIFSGAYDPGYSSNNVGGVMHVRCGPMKIKPGTRVAQLVVWTVVNPQGKYSGDYGFNPDGTPKSLEAKYHS